MEIGERIQQLRKQKGLSQDGFAGLFHVSRQTVSSWENGKSVPDLDMIVSISAYFQVSVDELVGRERPPAEGETVKRKRPRAIFLLLALLLAAGAVGLGIQIHGQARATVHVTMEKQETYRGTAVEGPAIDAGRGYFTLPESGNLQLKVAGSTDDGMLHVTIRDRAGRVCYALDGQELDDAQTLYFEQDAYTIQIAVDGHTEPVVSLRYAIEVKN